MENLHQSSLEKQSLIQTESQPNKALKPKTVLSMLYEDLRLTELAMHSKTQINSKCTFWVFWQTRCTA